MDAGYSITIQTGTTVVYEWTGRGGQHNVLEADGDDPLDNPSFESELVGEEGHEFAHTFEEPGMYDYVCSVHIAQDMIGSVEVVDRPVGNPPGPGICGSVSGGGDGGPGDRDAATHEVEMRSDGTEYLFDPIGLHVEPGDTVRWVMVSGAHSATAYAEGNGGASERRIPEGAEPWNSETLTETGAEFEYTFEEERTYDYFCIPHKTLGMIGRVVCGEPGGPAEESENPDFAGLESDELPSSEAIVKNGLISYPYNPSQVSGGDGVEGDDDRAATDTGSSGRADSAGERTPDRTGKEGSGIENIVTIARESVKDPGTFEFLLGGGILGGGYLAYRRRGSEKKDENSGE